MPYGPYLTVLASLSLLALPCSRTFTQYTDPTKVIRRPVVLHFLYRRPPPPPPPAPPLLPPIITLTSASAAFTTLTALSVLQPPTPSPPFNADDLLRLVCCCSHRPTDRTDCLPRFLTISIDRVASHSYFCFVLLSALRFSLARFRSDATIY